MDTDKLGIERYQAEGREPQAIVSADPFCEAQ
jgi:hypothetical protein